jgi:hypothetical protein
VIAIKETESSREFILPDVDMMISPNHGKKVIDDGNKSLLVKNFEIFSVYWKVSRDHTH